MRTRDMYARFWFVYTNTFFLAGVARKDSRMYGVCGLWIAHLQHLFFFNRYFENLLLAVLKGWIPQNVGRTKLKHEFE